MRAVRAVRSVPAAGSVRSVHAAGAVRAVPAVRAVRSVPAVRAVRAVRSVPALRAARAVPAVRAVHCSAVAPLGWISSVLTSPAIATASWRSLRRNGSQVSYCELEVIKEEWEPGVDRRA